MKQVEGFPSKVELQVGLYPVNNNPNPLIPS